MKSFEFWNWFDHEAAPKLDLRAYTFKKMFQYLDNFDNVNIVETGCMREVDNYAGDGCSTLLFHRYLQHNSGALFSVDIDAEAVELCKKSCAGINITVEDSVKYLHHLKHIPHLLYLDSAYDDVNTLQEFTAAAHLIRPFTMVGVDDSALALTGIQNEDGKLQLLEGSDKIAGKARLLAEYMQRIGAKLEFNGYQCGWIAIRG